MGSTRHCIAGIFVAAFALAVPRHAVAQTLNDVHFTDYTPLSSNMELARRLLTPLTSAALPDLVAKSGRRLSEQPVDLAQESFVVYVPALKPAQGYGLLVFVPPWNEAKIPPEWTDMLDQYGLIFVSAAKSGNDANPIGRREPLAVLAEQNIAKRYPLDPARIYVSGFSGGSRIAMRLALGYPDIFRGAILNSGSDPIGDAIVPLPPKDLFALFQDRSHLVYLTGERDMFVLQADAASRRAMRDWCVFNVDYRAMSGAGHEVASAAMLGRALDILAKSPEPDEADLAQCRLATEAALAAKVQSVKSLIAAGKRDDARALLTEMDGHFGGLAAPEIIELANSLAP